MGKTVAGLAALFYKEAQRLSTFVEGAAAGTFFFFGNCKLKLEHIVCDTDTTPTIKLHDNE
jgi:hypothetical protein